MFRKIKILVRAKCTSSPSFSSFPMEWCNEFLCTIYEEFKRILSDPDQSANDQETRKITVRWRLQVWEKCFIFSYRVDDEQIGSRDHIIREYLITSRMYEDDL